MGLGIDWGNSYYYTEGYKTIIRSCKDILLSNATFTPIINKIDLVYYKHNFHKYLRSLKDSDELDLIPEDMIWTISYLNNIENPNSDFSNLNGLWIINKDIVNNIIQVMNVRREN